MFILTFINNMIIYCSGNSSTKTNKTNTKNEKSKCKIWSGSCNYESSYGRRLLLWSGNKPGVYYQYGLVCIHCFCGHDGDLSLLWLRIQYWSVLVLVLIRGRGNNCRFHLCIRYAFIEWASSKFSLHGAVPQYYPSYRGIPRRLWKSNLQGWAVSYLKNQPLLLPALGFHCWFFYNLKFCIKKVSNFCFFLILKYN